MSDRGKEYRGQTLIIDGSRSGADIPHTKISYDCNGNSEYFGDSKYGVSEDSPKWYIEKLIYDCWGNVTDIVTATNEIYSGIVTLNIDSSSQPFVIVNITGLNQVLLDIINIGDSLNITTPLNLNKIQGTITALNRATNNFTIHVPTVSGIVDELGVVTGATDCIFALKNDDTKPFNKRTWSLRNQYIYK